MKYITNYRGYNIWQGDDGHMEAWQSSGINLDGGCYASNVMRRVLASSDIQGAKREIDSLKKKLEQAQYNPYDDKNQTKIE
jgi:hypothetical protein